MAGRTYRITDFAALAGVTVRALRHYERLGLVRPGRLKSGYRVYSDEHLAVLEQVVGLKFIGFPLKTIKGLLRRRGPELADALRGQRTILEDKKHLLDQAISAIKEAEDALRTGATVDSATFRRIIEVIEMDSKTQEWKERYDGLVQGKIERLKGMSPETKAALQERWTDLFNDVQEALNDDPSSPRAQALATRWVNLLAAFTPDGRLDPQLVKTFGAAIDVAKGPWKPTGPFADRRVWEFMQKALAVR
jgi:DNA-binding transcriptional MerR regulator